MLRIVRLFWIFVQCFRIENVEQFALHRNVIRVTDLVMRVVVC